MKHDSRIKFLFIAIILLFCTTPLYSQFYIGTDESTVIRQANKNGYVRISKSNLDGDRTALQWKDYAGNATVIVYFNEYGFSYLSIFIPFSLPAVDQWITVLNRSYRRKDKGLWVAYLNDRVFIISLMNSQGQYSICFSEGTIDDL